MGAANERLRPKLQEPIAGRVGLVIGATGATGRQVVKYLAERAAWSRVIIIGRRPFNLADYRDQFILTKDQANKIENVIVEDVYTKLPTVANKFEGVDTVFNCIGTTRKIAGSADSFTQIEFGITAEVAKIARQQFVPHCSVVTAQGTTSKIPPPPTNFTAPVFHSWLYVNTLGKKQDAVVEQHFAHTSVFKPGMLNRLVSRDDRMIEKVALKVLPSLRVDALAKLMVLDAENVPKYNSSQRVDLYSKGAAAQVEAPAIYDGNSTIMQQLSILSASDSDT